jgi:hypothetical protein
MDNSDRNRALIFEPVLLIAFFLFVLVIFSNNQSLHYPDKYPCSGLGELVIGYPLTHIDAIIAGAVSIPLIQQFYDNPLQIKILCSFSIQNKLFYYDRKSDQNLFETKRERVRFISPLVLILKSQFQFRHCNDVPGLS